MSFNDTYVVCRLASPCCQKTQIYQTSPFRKQVMKINPCCVCFFFFFLSTDVYFPFILILTFVACELHRVLADPHVVSWMSKNRIVRFSFFFFFFYNAGVQTGITILSLCFKLYEKAFGPRVSLGACVTRC